MTGKVDGKTNIRKWYCPVQPTVRQFENKVVYEEVFPDPLLLEYIYCYWQLKTDQPLETAFTYNVVADGCIDIFFELANPANSFVMGFCEQHTSFPLENSFHYVGVRFLPTMFTQIYGVDASVLTNRFEELNSVVPKASSFLSSQFGPDQDLHEIKRRLDAYFLKQVDEAGFRIDGRLYDAIDIILKNAGLVSIEQELDSGISPRQLRRLFSQYVGCSPKSFSRVVRFQHVLRAKPSRQSLRRNKIFFDHGYYDQAHFIKEFKTYYGLTPFEAFR